MRGLLAESNEIAGNVLELIRGLQRKADSKIILLVLDGLGGLSIEPGGPTALEAAATPNLDRLAQEGSTGLSVPILPGITPGSGPAHLALFGYDPLAFRVGRGVLEAAGVGLPVAKGSVAARGNFCSLDAQGRITDRRAGRLTSAQAQPLVNRLATLQVEGCEVMVRHVRDYRFAFVVRGPELGAAVSDTDPQHEGFPPLPAAALAPDSQRTASLVNSWIAQASAALSDQPIANGLTLRGFSTDPDLPTFPDSYGLASACVAVYPMYRGVSRLVGMDVVEFQGERPEDEFAAVRAHWHSYDFFFVHVKETDSRGEDGDFAGKAAAIESVDRALPGLLELKPSVLAVTGDHSTPARLRTHSWHPVPFLLWAPETIRQDGSHGFGETNCLRGGLGTFQAVNVMPLLLAHAQRLDKFGA